MKRELTWKQAYDLKIAENEQLRRDGNTIIDKVMAENKQLRDALKAIECHSIDHTDACRMAGRALEPKP